MKMPRIPKHPLPPSAVKAPRIPSAAARAVLDAAEALAQTRGYNGFSYADVAAQLGVTKASLHYHFPTKAKLGRALIERYHVSFIEALGAIDREAHEPCGKIQRYIALYESVLRNDRMCLCGMLAAEYATLPQPMQLQLQLFFDANERWLATVLEAGSRIGQFAFAESTVERARSLMGALEGALLIARCYGDVRRFRVAADCILADLCRAPARHPRIHVAGKRARAGGT